MKKNQTYVRVVAFVLAAVLAAGAIFTVIGVFLQ